MAIATKKLTALTKDPKKRDDNDIFELPDGAHGFGGPVLDVRSNGKDRRWSCKAVFRGNRITVQLGTVEELATVSAAKDVPPLTTAVQPRMVSENS